MQKVSYGGITRSYIHVYTNETHSLANLQDLIPTFAGIIIGNTN